MNDDVYCLMAKSNYDEAVAAGEYRPESLATEGFVHCVNLHQIVEVANMFYASVVEVVLARIERGRVHSGVVDEEAAVASLRGRGDSYPHIYGPGNMGAVVEVVEMPRDVSGVLVMPEDWT